MNSISFGQVISRLKYGTMLTIKEAYTGKELWHRTWPWHASTDIFASDVLRAEVNMFIVVDGGLLIEVILPDSKATQAGEGKRDGN